MRASTTLTSSPEPSLRNWAASAVLDFRASPGTTFILPQGTIDELRWKGPTLRIAVAIHPNLLVNALDETAHERSIELTEHWNLTDSNIRALLLAMTTDLDSGSPAAAIIAHENTHKHLLVAQRVEVG